MTVLGCQSLIGRKFQEKKKKNECVFINPNNTNWEDKQGVESR